MRSETKNPSHIPVAGILPFRQFRQFRQAENATLPRSVNQDAEHDDDGEERTYGR